MQVDRTVGKTTQKNQFVSFHTVERENDLHTPFRKQLSARGGVNRWLKIGLGSSMKGCSVVVVDGGIDDLLREASNRLTSVNRRPDATAVTSFACAETVAVVLGRRLRRSSCEHWFCRNRGSFRVEAGEPDQIGVLKNLQNKIKFNLHCRMTAGVVGYPVDCL